MVDREQPRVVVCGILQHDRPALGVFLPEYLEVWHLPYTEALKQHISTGSLHVQAYGALVLRGHVQRRSAGAAGAISGRKYKLVAEVPIAA